MDMSNICQICKKNPKAHSFHKLYEHKKISFFYTNPAEAEKYDDVDGIIKHMDNMLKQQAKNKWAWIFDAQGFECKHMIQLNLTKRIIDLISKSHSSNLEYIHIKNVNSTIKQFFHTIKPLINNHELGNKVRFDEK
jgi:hypothetical protein